MLKVASESSAFKKIYCRFAAKVSGRSLQESRIHLDTGSALFVNRSVAKLSFFLHRFRSALGIIYSTFAPSQSKFPVAVLIPKLWKALLCLIEFFLLMVFFMFFYGSV